MVPVGTQQVPGNDHEPNLSKITNTQVARQEFAAPNGPRQTPNPTRSPPNVQITELASAVINGADSITVELIQPDSMPAAVRIVWPTAPTITTPARYNEVASTTMRLLAEASTALARLRASKRR
jgi:hypothetical protein